jgi:hypothetical protein
MGGKTVLDIEALRVCLRSSYVVEFVYIPEYVRAGAGRTLRVLDVCWPEACKIR